MPSVEPIARRYVVDEHNRPIAVQIDLDVFERIEAVLEDHALLALIEAAEDEDVLGADAARAYYAGLPRAE